MDVISWDQSAEEEKKEGSHAAWSESVSAYAHCMSKAMTVVAAIHTADGHAAPHALSLIWGPPMQGRAYPGGCRQWRCKSSAKMAFL
jgi:hypothetical protein